MTGKLTCTKSVSIHQMAGEHTHPAPHILPQLLPPAPQPPQALPLQPLSQCQALPPPLQQPPILPPEQPQPSQQAYQYPQRTEFIGTRGSDAVYASMRTLETGQPSPTNEEYDDKNRVTLIGTRRVEQPQEEIYSSMPGTGIPLTSTAVLHAQQVASLRIPTVDAPRGTASLPSLTTQPLSIVSS